VNQLLTEAQVEDRLRHHLPVLADDVADRDDDVWTTATSPGAPALHRGSRRSLALVASAAAVIVIGVTLGVAVWRQPDRVATRSHQPAPEPPTVTVAPGVVRIADQPGGDAELLRLRRIADGVDVTVWRWDGQMGNRPPLEPIGANSGYFTPDPDDPAGGTVSLPFDGPTLAESSFLTISGPVGEGELRSLAAGIIREDAGGHVTYTIAVPETYQVILDAPATGGASTTPGGGAP
jgi:hypothetical protein